MAARWDDQPAIFDWDHKRKNVVFREEDDRLRLTFSIGENPIADIPTLSEIEAGVDLTSFLENYKPS